VRFPRPVILPRVFTDLRAGDDEAVPLCAFCSHDLAPKSSSISASEEQETCLHALWATSRLASILDDIAPDSGPALLEELPAAPPKNC